VEKDKWGPHTNQRTHRRASEGVTAIGTVLLLLPEVGDLPFATQLAVLRNLSVDHSK